MVSIDLGRRGSLADRFVITCDSLLQSFLAQCKWPQDEIVNLRPALKEVFDIELCYCLARPINMPLLRSEDT